MARFANPADKISTIASEPWKELTKGTSILDIADLVRIKQLQNFELETIVEQ